MLNTLRIFIVVCLCNFLLNISFAKAIEGPSLYGYFSTRYEKTFAEPTVVGSRVVKRDSPGEFTLPFINIMLQQQLPGRFGFYANINAASAGTLDIRNIWAEYTPHSVFNLRIGKMYRKFGLYNEILDAVPTYYGIEPPEMFDFDHLMISRTTSAMLYGAVPFLNGELHYSLSTDNGEGEVTKHTFPLNVDLRFTTPALSTYGLSLYTSGGKTTPDLAVGKGSPKSGVLPWMKSDTFSVMTFFTEHHIEKATLQAEYTYAEHIATRDPKAVEVLLSNADLNIFQRQRFSSDPSILANASTVKTKAHYAIQAFYLRSGYALETKCGEVGPYMQYDWYKNPETIAMKKYGGDNEAGVADNGMFHKGTIGTVYRPTDDVAIKLDGSIHWYKFNGKNTYYPELRLDFSFLFGK